MLPPTIMEQPTSVTMRLKAPITAANRPKRHSRISPSSALGQESPRVRAVSQARRSLCTNAA